MINPANFVRDLQKCQEPGEFSGPDLLSGMKIPPQKLVEIVADSGDWEQFVEEWAHALKPEYYKVQRWSGPGDMGCDVLGFIGEKQFLGVWDNYQCKHYADSLEPSRIWVELAKIIYYSFLRKYTPPRKYYFACPKGLTLSLKKLLAKPDDLKQGLIANWKKKCETSITDTQSVPLEGTLLEYLQAFDFRVFDSKSVVDILKGYATTPFWAVRFGVVGLKERPPVDAPPLEIGTHETRYVQQLLGAYADHLKIPVGHRRDLANWPHLEDDFNRARETFFHAESLRSFARDSVAEGTFEALREEIYHGVIDTCERMYADGLERARATVAQASSLNPMCNALCLRLKIQDKKGICHHLANEDRLTWVQRDA